MPPKNEDATECAECGAVTDGSNTNCQALFDGLLARDFSDALYFRAHRMAVDTYALQHPGRYCASAKSLAAHLVGLHWILERDGDPATGSEPLRRWLDGSKQLQKPDLPSFRGSVTVADVVSARTPTEYGQSVRRWAQSTWFAYSSLHSLARGWAEEAFAAQTKKNVR